ncbi:hypothetical protein MPC4_340030 [Methylocella tundrae]|uniref:Uncharacterized protein n=1 Tax=Methylocella tundrae TaxID=227605 RepID=A0A8B6M8S5_METTU|nr:hypothetical protein MPC1_8140001 [Methylocella tundrae]VTZ51274.1 hypothetical protein MPC4_340030 [Methylocella tundrae]
MGLTILGALLRLPFKKLCHLGYLSVHNVVLVFEDIFLRLQHLY